MNGYMHLTQLAAREHIADLHRQAEASRRVAELRTRRARRRPQITHVLFWRRPRLATPAPAGR